MPSTDSRVGTTLLERYRLEELIGAEGAIALYQARHVALDRRCIVAVVRGAAADPPTLIAALEALGQLEEARFAAASVDFAAADLILTFERHDGQSLASMGAVDLNRAISLTVDILRSVSIALAHGIKPWISPHNIFATGDSIVIYHPLVSAPRHPLDAVGELLRQLVADVPAWMAAIIDQPSQRWDDADAMIDALQSMGAGPLVADENVQFTVYRPKAIRPAAWYTLLAFAHLDEARDDEPDAPDPLLEVERQARRALGEEMADYRDTTADSRAAVPRYGELTFLPEIEGVEFNPPRHTLLWAESVHRAEFRMRAAIALEGTNARGRMSVFLGSILLADVPLRVKIASDQPSSTAAPVHEKTSARPYRKIFASYSHKDLAIVEQFERLAAVLGDRYLRDWKDLRSGEKWSERLAEMITEADVFQLFWSGSSMQSAFVKQEWEQALSLRREAFIRPVYWETPMPSAPGLPPPELAALHFQHLGMVTTAGAHPQMPEALGMAASAFGSASSVRVSGAQTMPSAQASSSRSRVLLALVAVAILGALGYLVYFLLT